MGYLGAGFVTLAVLGGIVGTVAVAAPPAAAATSTLASTPTPVPTVVSATPVLTQQPDGSWTTTITVNSAGLCPTPPAFALVTTGPSNRVPEAKPVPDFCAQATSGSVSGLTQVTLTFDLAAPPVTAAVVMTPASGGAPSTVTVAVHRLVSWWEYLWIPLICGAALAALLIAGIFGVGLPDASKPSGDNGRPKKMRGRALWRRPMYAATAWSFGGSWATNITTLATAATAVLAATGTVSELLPGVETGRFSLLIAVAGLITLGAPLLFGALNYSFERVDPTTTGASMITLPTGQMAILSGSLRTWPRERLLRQYRYSGAAVKPANPDDLLPSAERARRRAQKRMCTHKKRFAVRPCVEVTRPDGEKRPLPAGYRAVLTEKGQHCEIAVPAGATMTVFGAASVNAAAEQSAQAEPSVPDFTQLPPDFTEVPAGQCFRIYSGVTVTVPAGGTVTVTPPQPSGQALPCMSMPGTTDIVLSAGVTLAVDPWFIVAGKDTNLTTGKDASQKHAKVFHKGKDTNQQPVADDHANYAVRAAQSVVLAGNAKVSFLGTASLGLPAGTLVASPRLKRNGPQAMGRQSALRTSSVPAWTPFQLPHTGEVIASRMWALLIASLLTLFGTGAEIGLLGVLAFGLSTGSLAIRSACVALLAVSAVVVSFYSVISILALADPTPGDAMSTANGSSFLL